MLHCNKIANVTMNVTALHTNLDVNNYFWKMQLITPLITDRFIYASFSCELVAKTGRYCVFVNNPIVSW